MFSKRINKCESKNSKCGGDKHCSGESCCAHEKRTKQKEKLIGVCGTVDGTERHPEDERGKSVGGNKEVNWVEIDPSCDWREKIEQATKKFGSS